MKDNRTFFRSVSLSLIMLIISGSLVLRAAYLQLVNGEQYAALATQKIQRVYNENASRGSIYDRNGRPLVTNELGFEIVFDYLSWDKTKQNAIILELCHLMNNANLEYYDTLPITARPPFTYTYDNREEGDGARLYSFISQQKDWPTDPTALQLFELLCEKYKVDSTLTISDKRAIIGVRYEMQRRDFSSYTPFTFAENVDIATVTRVSERSVSLTGITVQVNDIRKYNTPYAAHVLGRVGLMDPDEYKALKPLGYPMNASVGKDGVEKAFENHLRSIDGKRAVTSDDSGAVVTEFIKEDPQPGDNCYLTLDIDLQQVAEQSLASTIANIKSTKKPLAGQDAEGASAVVIDVKTGGILALANYPSYNLETFSADYSTLMQNTLKPMFNRAIAGVFPPGSTFKMATATAVLEEKIVTPQTKIRDEGIYMYYAPSYTPKCWLYGKNHSTHGNINVSDAIKYSCNYFFYETSRQLGIEKLNKYASEMGLGSKTGIELSGEKAGNLAGPASRAANGGDTWYAGETIQAAIGQSEQQFTPIQLCSYVATIASGGVRYQPHLLKQVKNYSSTEIVETPAPKVVGRITMSESTRQAVFKGMLGVTTDDGTASSLFRNFPIQIAGKTGSAQTQPGKRSDHGVFVSFAPYENPEIAICIIGEYAGSGGNMAPVAIDIYNQYFQLNKPDTGDMQ